MDHWPKWKAKTIKCLKECKEEDQELGFDRILRYNAKRKKIHKGINL